MPTIDEDTDDRHGRPSTRPARVAGGGAESPSPRVPVRRRATGRAVLAAALLATGAGLYCASSSAADRARAWRWLLPEGLEAPRVPAANPMSRERVELGRRLFYDTRLSANFTGSCGTCHLQAKAFADGRTRAVGTTGERHRRNTPSIVNAAYAMGAAREGLPIRSMEEQAHAAIFGTEPTELGVTAANERVVLARIQSHPGYLARFRAAFPGRRHPVTWDAVAHALASFTRSIVAADATQDRARAGRAALTPSELRGLALFRGRAGCASCHGGPLFDGSMRADGRAAVRPQFRNNGLYDLGGGAYPAADPGLVELTGDPADAGRFRVPSLRNVELTAPYMHDGSIATLAEVVAAYSRGGRRIASGPLAGDGATSPHKDPKVRRLDLSAREQADLVAYLRTLTDRRVLTDPRFADPFGSRPGGAAPARREAPVRAPARDW